MFMNDVRKKEEIRNVAIQDLRSFGIKYRSKKPKSHVQVRMLVVYVNAEFLME